MSGGRPTQRDASAHAKREHRIAMEIIVDRAISPVYKGDEVEILGMAPEREGEHEMFVETHWGRRNLAIPLAQVKPMRSTNLATRQAVADRHYWVGSGRTF